MWKLSKVKLHIFITVYFIDTVLGCTSLQYLICNSGLVGAVMPAAPNRLIQVTYPNNVPVRVGRVLTPTLVKCTPIVQFVDTCACSCNFYTLMLLDPDTPTMGTFQHWIVGNIPDGRVGYGETITEYVGAAPGKGSGYHRYTFVVYKQPGRLFFDEPRISNTNGPSRGFFSVQAFLDKYRLGKPVAANFFFAKYDNYVPTLNQQIGL